MGDVGGGGETSASSDYSGSGGGPELMCCDLSSGAFSRVYDSF